MIIDRAHENSCHGQPKAAPRAETLDLEAVRARLAEAKGPQFWRSLEELADDPRFRDMVHREFPRQASEWVGDLAGTAAADGLTDASRRNFLKLSTASLALAGLTACTRQPLERIVPYVKQPEEIVPGKPLFFATAFAGGSHGAFAQGVLVESHLGRPTKIEGNPDHPWSLGATDQFAQASILTLYDPDRSQTVTYLGRVQSWDNFLASVQPTLAAEAASGGAGIRLLTGSVTSPTLSAQLQAFLASHPQAQWHQWESAGRDNVRAGARLAFGEAVETRYDLSQADIVVTVDSDLLTAGPGAVRYARQFADRRRVPGEGSTNERMNRLYSVESSPTLTATMADHRLALAPHQVNGFVLGLAQAVGAAAVAAPAEGRVAAFITALAKDLQANRGRSLVVAGDEASAEIHALVHAMNQALGNIGSTVLYTESVEAEAPGSSSQLASLKALVDDLNAGKVRLLVALGTNPLYDAPADFAIKAAFEKATLRVHVGLYADETAELCHWQVPEAHFLETWGDARAIDGATSIQQPLIEPLYGGKSLPEVVAALNGDRSSAMDLVKATWTGRGLDEAAWRKALHDGLVPATDAASKSPVIAATSLAQASATLQAATSDPGFTVIFRPDPTLGDGRWANNGWLQELPKPLTKLTWDNALLISPKTSEALRVQHEQVVELSAGGRSVKVPIWVQPGHADGCGTLHLGHGRTRAGRVGDAVGTDIGPLRSSQDLWMVAGVAVKATGETYTLASTQMHFNIFDGEGLQAKNRHLVRTTGLAELVANPEAIHEMEEAPDKALNLYPGFEYNGYSWGLAVDLNSCTGCNACVVACQSENNVPVVGKEMVSRGREMHWIRIDRYFGGDLDDPSVFHQPLMCMHCEQAPCEGVCPVAATVHSTEGLNDMVYNRCVGTRYCANNCPYKVRRFNYLYWNGNTYNDVKSHPVLDLMKNPDVTVRSRGVMEKCTYCVQRINRVRIQARVEDRKIKDGEIKVACQQVCPAQAISFGDINNATAEVRKLKDSKRNYGLLEELNTRPRTTYLARITNRNPELESRS